MTTGIVKFSFIITIAWCTSNSFSKPATIGHWLTPVLIKNIRLFLAKISMLIFTMLILNEQKNFMNDRQTISSVYGMIQIRLKKFPWQGEAKVAFINRRHTEIFLACSSWTVLKSDFCAQHCFEICGQYYSVYCGWQFGKKSKCSELQSELRQLVEWSNKKTEFNFTRSQVWVSMV